MLTMVEGFAVVANGGFVIVVVVLVSRDVGFEAVDVGVGVAVAIVGADNADALVGSVTIAMVGPHNYNENALSIISDLAKSCSNKINQFRKRGE